MSGPFDSDDDEPGDLEHDNSTNGGVDLTHLDKDAKTRLLQVVSRLESINEEKRSLTARAKELLDEAKAQGLQPKIIRAVVSRRKMKPSDLEEFDTLVELYSGVFG